MARIALGDALSEHQSIQATFHAGSLTLKDHSASRAVFEDRRGNEIVFLGSGLKYDGGELTYGRLTGAIFLDRGGDVLMRVTQARAPTEGLQQAFSDGVWTIMDFLAPRDNGFIGTEQGDDIIIGRNPGDDWVRAGAGDDWVKGTAGDNRLDGGSGFDHLWYTESYFQATARRGVVLDVEKGRVLNPWGGQDRISGFEEYRGSRFDDRMLGGSGDDIFHGLGGRDVLDGRGGYDVLRYRSDAEFDGGKAIVVDFAKGLARDGFGTTDRFRNIEEVSGTAGNDRFRGDDGDNVFTGFEGRDRYDGGEGIDVIKLAHWSNATGIVQVDLSLARGQVIDDGYGNRETARNVEAVSGSQSDDRLALGAHDRGWAWGDEGDDLLIAGTGAAQWLGGGEGADRFVFLSAQHLGAGQSRDVIDDFSSADGDQIDLDALGPLTFVGRAAFTGGRGELRYETRGEASLVEADLDGDRRADVELWLNGVAVLEAKDFVLG